MENKKQNLRRSWMVAILSLHVAILGACPNLYASVTIPGTINYQGRLLNAFNVPLTGSYEFRFSFWKTADWVSTDTLVDGSINTGSANYAGWQEEVVAAVGSFGLFNLQVGNVVPFPALNANTHKFMQVEVKGASQAETAYEILDPQGSVGDGEDRKTLGNQFYAQNADTVDNADIGVANGNLVTLGAGNVFPVSTIPGGTNTDSFTLDSDNNAAGSVALKWGADPTPAENGNLTWNLATNRFGLDHSLDIAGGLTTTGNANFTSTSEFHIRETANHLTAACTTANELILNTTENRIYKCATPGSPGSWVSTIPAAADFESIYSADGDQDLNSGNGLLIINTGTNDLVVDSNDWNVTNAGALDAATLTSNGLLTGTGGATVSGGTVNINSNSNNPTSLNTGTSTGAVSVGGGSGTVSVNSSSWDISTAGVASGLTGLSTGGTVALGNNTGTVAIDSSDWDIGATGNATGIGSVNMDGLLTGTGGATLGGAAVNLNADSNFAVNIATGTSTGTVTLGGTGSQTIAVGNGAGAKTVSLGSSNTTSTTTLLSGSGGLNVNENNNQSTNINTGTSTGTVSIGGGSGTVAVDSSVWDISATGAASGLTGITSANGSISLNDNSGANTTSIGGGTTTGGITIGGTGAQTIDIGNGAGAKTVGLGSSNTTSTTTLLSGSGGININVGNNQPTNIATGTSTGALSLGGGAGTVAVDSSVWDISSAGAVSGVTTLNMDGLLTGTGGATLGGAAVNLNADSNFAVNIGTGTSTGTITLGGTGAQTIAVGNGAGAKTVSLGSSNTTSTTTLLSGSGGLNLNTNNNQATNLNTGTSTGALSLGGGAGTVAVDSSSWDVSSAGVASGFTGLTSTGTVNFSGAGSQRVREVSDYSAATCTTVNEIVLDTTQKRFYICTATGSPGTWVAKKIDQMSWEPEYPDTVLFPDGTNNSGTMTSNYDSTNRRQYYQWLVSNASLQDVDLRIRHKLPSDFKTAGDLTLMFRTLNTVSADNAVSITLRNDTNDTTCASSLNNVNSVANTWQTITISAASIGTCGGSALAAEKVIEIQVKFFARSSNYAQTGILNFDYTN